MKILIVIRKKKKQNKTSSCCQNSFSCEGSRRSHVTNTVKLWILKFKNIWISVTHVWMRALYILPAKFGTVSYFFMSIDQPLEFIPWCSCAGGLLLNVVLFQPFLLRGEPVWLCQGGGVWVWGVLKSTNTSGTLSPSTPGMWLLRLTLFHRLYSTVSQVLLFPFCRWGSKDGWRGWDPEARVVLLPPPHPASTKPWPVQSHLLVFSPQKRKLLWFCLLVWLLLDSSQGRRAKLSGLEAKDRPETQAAGQRMSIEMCFYRLRICSRGAEGLPKPANLGICKIMLVPFGKSLSYL